MAKGIQDLGTGLGYLYKVKPDGTTIVAVEKNTADGVRSMKIAGTNNGPVIAQRPAVATITVNSVASVGAITAITIGGVNQIAANINITTSTASVAAALIADRINRYSPTSGVSDFTAQAIGAVVYVYSEPSDGSAANGLTITVSVTDPSIVTTTTDFTNGSSENGVYDSTFGYRFYIDADYNGTASPTVLTYALEITEYMTVRGLQSGIYTTNSTIGSDAITGVTRTSAITQIFVYNQGGAASDVLAYLQVENFAEGDEVRLSPGDPGVQIPTIEDARSTTSPVSSPNIYLTDETPFVMDSFGSLTLQLRNISGVGLTWIETGRSIANAVISTTVLGIATLAGASSLRPNALYLITDLGDGGTYVTADSTTQIQSVGYLIRKVPRNYTGCWRTGMGAPVVGSRYRYYQNVYQSLTGAVGTAPDTDTVNWVVIAKTNTTYYQSQVHSVGLNDAQLLGSWPFIWERDNHNNMISQSLECFSAMAINAYNVFSWRTLTDTAVYGNTVIDGVFDCANSDGSVYQNSVTYGGKFDGNSLPTGTIVAGNNVTGTGSRIYSNFVTNIIGNTVKDSGLMYSNGASGSFFNQLALNTVQGSITGLTSLSAGAKSVEYCVVERGAEVKNSTFAGASMIRYTTVRAGAVIQNSVFSAPSSTTNIESCEISGNSTLELTDGGGRLVDCKIHETTATINLAGFLMTNVGYYGSTVTMTADASSANAHVDNSTLSFTGSLNSAYLTGISTSGTPTIAITGVITPNGSSMEGQLDLDDAGVFSAGQLIIDPNYQLCGKFILLSTAVRNISEVSGLPTPYEVLFVTSSTNNITFTGTAAATLSGNQIAATAATFVIKAFASSASSMLWMANPYGVNTITRTAVLI